MYAISSNFFSSSNLCDRLIISTELIVLLKTCISSFTNSDINLGSSIPLITALLKALPQKALENISNTVETAVSNSEAGKADTSSPKSISVNAEESEDNDSVCFQANVFFFCHLRHLGWERCN